MPTGSGEMAGVGGGQGRGGRGGLVVLQLFEVSEAKKVCHSSPPYVSSLVVKNVRQCT